jgi:catecholate siderophore receptor
VAKTVSLTRGNVSREEDGYSNQTELTQHAELGGMQHTVLYGVEFGTQNKYQLVRSQANVATVSLFNPVAPVVPFAAAGAPSTNNLGIFKVSSAYVQDQMALTPEWKALAGIRYDRFQQQTQQRIAGQTNLERTDRNLEPARRPGVPAKRHAVLLRVVQPLLPAVGRRLLLAANNVDIAPETTKNNEIGAKYDLFGGRASAGVSVFQLTRDNMKVTDPISNKLLPVGTQRTNGVELTFSGNLGDGWQAWAGYAYLDGKMISSIAKDDGQLVQGKRPTLTPEHSANLWLYQSAGRPFWRGCGYELCG